MINNDKIIIRSTGKKLKSWARSVTLHMHYRVVLISKQFHYFLINCVFRVVRGNYGERDIIFRISKELNASTF